jgi:hypothetical protein
MNNEDGSLNLANEFPLDQLCTWEFSKTLEVVGWEMVKLEEKESELASE